ncbi:unnamed protein product [Alopecurus aequalis]
MENPRLFLIAGLLLAGSGVAVLSAGDGEQFVFFVGKDNLSGALPSSYMGLLNSANNGDASNHVLGVELDTIQSTEFKDPNDNHVGIDVNSLESVWVYYESVSTQISVYLSPLKKGAKPSTALVSATRNLSEVLEDPAYAGFSSSTGTLRSRHYVLGWSLAMDGPAPRIDIGSLPKMPLSGAKAISKVLEIVLPIATAAFVLGVVAAAILILRRRSKFPKRAQGAPPQVQALEVAVKKVSRDSRQGIKEFVAEVVTIACLRHRNLVQLLGYCRRKGELLLVYEYMSNSSLDKYLYGSKDKPPATLDWAQRFRIIKGVASGLLYIHEDFQQVIIHRDIKASNVLLDADMNARLGDFGLAQLYDHGADPQTTRVVCTMSPLTDGQGAMDDGRLVLMDWVLEHWHKESLLEVVDARLGGHHDVDEAVLALKLGLMCSHPLPGARPSMRQVMQYLQGDTPLPELTPAQMQSEGFDSFVVSQSSSGTITGLSGGR